MSASDIAAATATVATNDVAPAKGVSEVNDSLSTIFSDGENNAIFPKPQTPAIKGDAKVVKFLLQTLGPQMTTIWYENSTRNQSSLTRRLIRKAATDYQSIRPISSLKFGTILNHAIDKRTEKLEEQIEQIRPLLKPVFNFIKPDDLSDVKKWLHYLRHDGAQITLSGETISTRKAIGDNTLADWIKQRLPNSKDADETKIAELTLKTIDLENLLSIDGGFGVYKEKILSKTDWIEKARFQPDTDRLGNILSIVRKSDTENYRALNYFYTRMNNPNSSKVGRMSGALLAFFGETEREAVKHIRECELVNSDLFVRVKMGEKDIEFEDEDKFSNQICYFAGIAKMLVVLSQGKFYAKDSEGNFVLDLNGFDWLTANAPEIKAGGASHGQSAPQTVDINLMRAAKPAINEFYKGQAFNKEYIGYNLNTNDRATRFIPKWKRLIKDKFISWGTASLPPTILGGIGALSLLTPLGAGTAATITLGSAAVGGWLTFKGYASNSTSFPLNGNGDPALTGVKGWFVDNIRHGQTPIILHNPKICLPKDQPNETTNKDGEAKMNKFLSGAASTAAWVGSVVTFNIPLMVTNGILSTVNTFSKGNISRIITGVISGGIATSTLLPTLKHQAEYRATTPDPVNPAVFILDETIANATGFGDRTKGWHPFVDTNTAGHPAGSNSRFGPQPGGASAPAPAASQAPAAIVDPRADLNTGTKWRALARNEIKVYDIVGDQTKKQADRQANLNETQIG